MGPPLRKEAFQSGKFVVELMEGKMEMIKSEHFAAVDVRDVAKAHLLAIKNPAAANRRFILCAGNYSYHQYAAPIAAKYTPLGWPITTNLQPANPEEKVTIFNNAASKELGIEYIDFAKTMTDMADAMVALGSVVKPAAAQ